MASNAQTANGHLPLSCQDADIGQSESFGDLKARGEVVEASAVPT